MMGPVEFDVLDDGSSNGKDDHQKQGPDDGPGGSEHRPPIPLFGFAREQSPQEIERSPELGLPI